MNGLGSVTLCVVGAVSKVRKIQMCNLPAARDRCLVYCMQLAGVLEEKQVFLFLLTSKIPTKV